MKTKAIALALALCVLAGCATGGGGGNDGGGGGSSAQAEPLPLVCVFLPFICILMMFDDSVASASSPGSAQPPVPFTTWAELKRDARTDAPGIGSSLTYEASADGIIRAVGNPAATDGATVQYDANGKLVGFIGGSASFGSKHSGDLAALGQPGIDRLHGPSGNTALVGNPYALGWNYQSFGAWNQQNAAGSGTISVSSFGQATPASAVPTSGQATFTGKSAGFYVSPNGQGSITAAEVAVSANFSARSLGFSTSATTTARDLKAPVSAPQLNVSGTLTYRPGSNAFSGSVANAGGTLSGRSSGQFYGPAAQELGGVFHLRSSTTPEAFVGAYGAKR
jgi:hypothetical protein